MLKAGKSKDEQEDKITEERSGLMATSLVDALGVYKKNNMGLIPSQIIIYRDGLGGPSMINKVINNELPQVLSAIKGVEAGYEPKILYVFVEKRATYRLFEINGGYHNPPSGTVVDS